MKKTLSLILAALLTLSLLAGCSPKEAQQTPAAPSEPTQGGTPSGGGEDYGTLPDYISIGANPSGQTAYTWAAGIADVINKAGLGMTATAEETSGYPVNVQLMYNGEIEFGFVNNMMLEQAYNATDSYSDYDPGQILGIMTMSPTEMHVLTLAGSGVESVRGFAGKRVGIGQPGGISREVAIMMLEAAGYGEGDFERIEVNLATQVEYLQDGQLDVLIWFGSAALPAITELCATKDVVFLDIDEDVIDNLRQAHPTMERCTIADGTYTDQTGDIQTFCLRNTLAVSANVSNECVYQVTKLIMENVEALSAVHGALGNISPDTVLTGLTADTPLHPGALRYYQEIGVAVLDKFE